MSSKIKTVLRKKTGIRKIAEHNYNYKIEYDIKKIKLYDRNGKYPRSLKSVRILGITNMSTRIFRITRISF